MHAFSILHTYASIKIAKSECSTGRLYVGEGALGEDGLGDDAGEGKHGETAVLDLLELHLVDLLLGLVLEEADGVEAEITGGTAGSVEGLHEGDGADDLGEAEPEEELAHGAVLDEGVVGGDGGEALVGLGEGVDAKAAVDGAEAEPGHHADAAVLELGLAEEVHGDEVGEAEGIEANIADVSLEVLRVGEEGEGGGLLSGEAGGGLFCYSEKRENRM